MVDPLGLAGTSKDIDTTPFKEGITKRRPSKKYKTAYVAKLLRDANEFKMRTLYWDQKE